MIPEFRYGILAAEVPPPEDGGPLQSSLLFQLQLIFANLQESEKQYYSPKGFTKVFKFYGQTVDVRV